MRRSVLAFAAAVCCGAVPSTAGQTNAADPVRTPLLQNETLAVTHLRFGPGTREATHTHPFPLVLVQITPGEIGVQEQNTTKRGNRAGEVWYIPADRPHAVTSQPNANAAVDLVAVAILPTRPASPNPPVTDAPPGITRTTLVDNNDTRVVRVRFGPGAAEPVHEHPNDLLTIQITRGKLDIALGTEHQSQEREPGAIQFLPRNVRHAYMSIDTKPFELISLTVK